MNQGRDRLALSERFSWEEVATARVRDAKTRPERPDAVRRKPARSDRRPDGRVSRLSSPVLRLLAWSGRPGLYLAYEQFRVSPGSRGPTGIRRTAVRRGPRTLARVGSRTARFGRGLLLPGMGGPGRRSTGEAVQAIDQARKLGFDPALLDCLSAIGHARADRFNEAEPILEQAFVEQLEPRDMVAKELARIYLSTYRLERAAWRSNDGGRLAPEIPSLTCGATRSPRGPTSSRRS